MSTGKSLTKSDVTFETPTDPTHPGFAVKGYKLRWLSGSVESRRAGRIWEPIKLSQFSKEVQDKIRSINPRWIDGDTIRKRNDLTLGMAPLELVNERRAELRRNQNANEAIFRPGANVGNGIKTDGDSSSVTKKIAAESTADDFR